MEGQDLDSRLDRKLAITTVTFALALHFAIPLASHGSLFYVRPFDLYIIRGFLDPILFSADPLWAAWENVPYTLYHSLVAKALLGGVASEAQIFFLIYFAAQTLLLTSYFSVAWMVFRDGLAAVIFTTIAALNFRPWDIGSTFGINVGTLTMNLMAIPLEVLTLCLFLRQRFLFAAVALAGAYYVHFNSACVLTMILSILTMLQYGRPGQSAAIRPKQMVMALLALSAMAAPLFYLLVGFVNIQLKVAFTAWQLESVRESIYGHVSLQLLRERYSLFWLFMAMFAAFAVFGLRDRRQGMRTLSLLAGIAFVLGCGFSFLTDRFLLGMQAEALKSTFWFVQLILALYVAGRLSDAVTRREGRSPETWIPTAFAALMMLWGFRTDLFGLLIAMTAVFLIWRLQELTRTRGTLTWLGLSALLVLAPLTWAYLIERSDPTPGAYRLEDRDFSQAVRAANQLSGKVLLLYPFAFSNKFFAVSTKPGLYNSTYIASMSIGSSRLVELNTFIRQTFSLEENYARLALSAWKDLTPERLSAIVRKYGVTHVIAEKDKSIQGTPIFQNQRYTLYQLPGLRLTEFVPPMSLNLAAANRARGVGQKRIRTR